VLTSSTLHNALGLWFTEYVMSILIVLMPGGCDSQRIIGCYEMLKRYWCHSWHGVILCRSYLSHFFSKKFSNSWCEYSVKLCEVMKQSKDTYAMVGTALYFGDKIYQTVP
jgi:hypothetical protein